MSILNRCVKNHTCKLLQKSFTLYRNTALGYCARKARLAPVHWQWDRWVPNSPCRVNTFLRQPKI